MPIAESAAALASVVGLLGQFLSGRDAAKSRDFDAFMQWLAESNHSELKGLIESNHKTTIGVKAILAKNMDQLRDSLERIDAALAAFTSAIDGFSQLGEGLRPNLGLSDQAIGLLRQTEAAQASMLLVTPGALTTPYDDIMFLDGDGRRLEIPEPRFLRSDIQSLVAAGMLMKSTNSRGNPIYTITRSAARLVAGSPNQ